MAFHKTSLSVAADILEYESGDRLDKQSEGVSVCVAPCPPGCTCGLHNRLGLTPEELAERRRAKAAARSRRYQARIRSEKESKRQGNPCAPDCTCNRHDSAAWTTRRESQQQWSRQHPVSPEQRRAHHLKHRFGLTPEQWDQMLAEQDGCCYLCSEPLDTENRRRIHVDHDHSCCRGDKTCGNCIRGLACDPCNKGIGMFGESPERLMHVAANLAAANARVATLINAPADINRAARRREAS